MVSFKFSKGESYACHQEQAYHTVPGRFNLGVIVTHRARAGGVSSAFTSSRCERYARYEPEVAEALTDMFVSGTSTQKVGKMAEKLLGVAPSASAVSRLNQALTEQYEAWRVRPLLAHYRIIYLDGIHFTVRHGAKTDATMILTALGVDLEGSREVLAFRACAEEDKDGWSCLLQDLRTRGVSQIDLIVTDGHDGLLAAVASLFPPRLVSAAWFTNSAT